MNITINQDTNGDMQIIASAGYHRRGTIIIPETCARELMEKLNDHFKDLDKPGRLG